MRILINNGVGLQIEEKLVTLHSVNETSNMSRIHDSDDDDDDYSRPSSLSQTQRFMKSGNPGSRDLKMTSTKSKYSEVPISNLNLRSVHDDDDSLNDSDDDTTTKTGRSTSSATPSQLTPKPRERSFVRNTSDKPKVQPRRIDVDDDDRNVFGQTMKPSPRHHVSTLREDEERDQSFAQGFRGGKKPKSPTDMFAADSKPRSTVNSRKFHSDRSSDEVDSDDASLPNKHGKSNSFQKSPRSPTDNFKPSSRKNSTKSKGDSDRSDDENNHHSNRQFTRDDFTKKRSSHHDLAQVISLIES